MLTSALVYLFANSDLLLRCIDITQIHERPRKLRRVANNLKRTLYSRRTNKRRAQNFVPTYQLFNGSFQQWRTKLPFDTNNAKCTEGSAASSLLQRPQISLLRRKPKPFYC